MTYEHQKTFIEGSNDTRTSNNLPYMGVMVYEHLETFSLGVLWHTNIKQPSIYGRYGIRTSNNLLIGALSYTNI